MGSGGGSAQGPTMRLCCETRWEVMREVGRPRVGTIVFSMATPRSIMVTE